MRERASEVEVTASAVVAAVQAYAKINDAGKWIERSESVNLTELFDKMSTQELAAHFCTRALAKTRSHRSHGCGASWEY